MKLGLPAILALLIALPLAAELKRGQRKSLLNSDPEVVYLEEIDIDPIQLQVVKAAPVFFDREGKRKIGTLKSGQSVTVEALADKVYRVRGQDGRDGIVGWVAPWAFSSKDPEFVKHLKEFYDRELTVQALIAEGAVTVGMTLDEVSRSRGKPTKTNIRNTSKGRSGRWEYIDYKDIKHYATRIDPQTGQAYRVFSHMTRIEKSKTTVEFADGIVTAVEQSEDNQGTNIRIVMPPVRWGW